MLSSKRSLCKHITINSIALTTSITDSAERGKAGKTRVKKYKD